MEAGGYAMQTMEKTEVARPTVNKQELLRILEEQDARLGLRHDPTVTAAEVRAMMFADGVCPEDNLFSRGIIAAREE
jgi:hypothetical protein